MFKTCYIFCLIFVLIAADGHRQDDDPYVVRRHKRSPLLLKKKLLTHALLGKALHRNKIIVIKEPVYYIPKVAYHPLITHEPHHLPILPNLIRDHVSRLGGFVKGIGSLASNLLNRKNDINATAQAAASAAASAADAAKAAASASASAANAASSAASATASAAIRAPSQPIVPYPLPYSSSSSATNEIPTPNQSYSAPYQG